MWSISCFSSPWAVSVTGENLAFENFVEEVRRRGHGPSQEDLSIWRTIVNDPIAFWTLRTLAGDVVDEMPRLLSEERDLVVTVARAIEEFARHGWAASFRMPIPAVKEALRLHDSGAPWTHVEQVLHDGWSESASLDRLSVRVGAMGAADDELWAISKQRARLIEAAWSHHTSGAFEASIPIVLAQIDGIVSDATTSAEKPNGMRFFSAGPNQADVVDEETLAGISGALPVVRDWFSEAYWQTDDKGSANRHGVMHGRELAYDTAANSTKCFVLLLAVWEWANRVFQIEADRRKAVRYQSHAGSDEVDERGWRYDRRGFTETRLALKNLDLAQRSYRDRTNRYGSLDDLRSDAVARLLYKAEGQEVVVLSSAEHWWAWSQSESGWVFAIANTPDTGPWYYDGQTPPVAPPPSSGWRLNDDGNWSGDCYW